MFEVKKLQILFFFKKFYKFSPGILSAGHFGPNVDLHLKDYATEEIYIAITNEEGIAEIPVYTWNQKGLGISDLKVDYVAMGDSRISGFSSCDLDEIARKNAKIIGTSFRSRTKEQVYVCVDRFKVDLMDAFLTGKVVSVVDRCFKLDAIAEAQAYLCSNNHVGKISIDINF